MDPNRVVPDVNMETNRLRLLWGKQLPLNKLPVATRVVLWWLADIGDVDISPSKDAG